MHTDKAPSTVPGTQEELTERWGPLFSFLKSWEGEAKSFGFREFCGDAVGVTWSFVWEKGMVDARSEL